ncbi:MAG: YigZ family protein [Bacteroidales bacterium]
MEQDEFLTINKAGEGLYKEKGSKFIGYAEPVEKEEDIKTILDNIKAEHHNARHHCYAYRLGINKEIFRMNDDGEPSSTAGKPIYGQILANNLTNIIIIVVRYFGGTKLGTSGLIRAYKTAAEEAIKKTTIIKRTVGEIFIIEFDYDRMNEVMKIIHDESLKILDKDFQSYCTFTLGIRKKNQENLINRIKQSKGIKITKANKTVYM